MKLISQGLILLLTVGAVWGSALAADYVGSKACFSCHPEQYNEWQTSGHSRILRSAEKARDARFPLPPGYAWDEISYVVGGANKRINYINKEGYLVTGAKDGSEARTQYNLEDDSWSFYHKGQKKPFSCGPCHMTAYSKEGHQDGIEGIVGTWVEDSVGCEECHGPGSDHVKSLKYRLRLDVSAEACGKCHQRGGIGPNPPVQDGFLRHHQQLNELKSGVHKGLRCTNCHNPHRRAIMARDNCGSCHTNIRARYSISHHGRQKIRCIECHMPKATKSAISVASYTGDIRTHIFKINTDANADMFMEITEKGKSSLFAKGFLTVEYACLSCHGGRDKAWAAKNARNLHDK